MKQRLQKILARAGIASRRKAEELILEGRVSINGTVVLELGAKADPSADIISLDNMAIGSAENKVYVMLHKPPGYITTLSDPEGRPTVMNIVSGIPERIVPVGRLDFETEGLLILTNDGDFSQMLQHPRFQIERRYRVKVKGIPSPAALEKLMSGIYIDGVRTNRCSVRVIDRLQKNAWLEVRLREGRNRQIRRMFEAIGHDAIRIIRTGFGPLELSDLPIGAFRFLAKKEIESIRSLEQAAPAAPTRRKARATPASASASRGGKPAGWAVAKQNPRPSSRRPAEGISNVRHGNKPPGKLAAARHGRATGKPGPRNVNPPGKKPTR